MSLRLSSGDRFLAVVGSSAIIVIVGVALLARPKIVCSIPSPYTLNKEGIRKLHDAVKLKDWGRVVSLLLTPVVLFSERPNPDEYAALCAINELVQAGAVAAPAVAEDGLRSSHPQIRYMSLLVLGRIGNEKHLDLIRSVLHDEGDSRVLISGAEALCLLGKPGEAGPLVEEVLHLDCDRVQAMFGDSLMRGHFMIRPYEVAEYLNRRFKLGLEVPAQLYRYIDPVDIEKYPLSK